MSYRIIIFLFFMMNIISCGAAVDPTSLQISLTDQDTLDIPDKCERFYDDRRYVVAVAEYANNTTYKDAQVTSSKSYSGKGGGQSFSTFDQVSKDLSPQLGQFAQGAVESILVSMGGVTVAARAQMEQILTEQQFQMTLADPETAVDFGMLIGAQYIVTGSVDNINLTYKSPMQGPQNSGSDLASTLTSMLFAVGAAAYNTTTGWNVETEMTTNIIDVATGEIVATKRTKGEKVIGDAPMFTMDQVIAGAKAAMSLAVAQSLTYLSAQFEVKGYVNELRGNKRAALISIGSNNGLREGDRLQAFDMNVQKDFRSGTQTCTLTPLSIELVVLPALQPDYAWVLVNASDTSKLSKLKIGSIVRRMPVSR